jgi:hypothetical protein
MMMKKLSFLALVVSLAMLFSVNSALSTSFVLNLVGKWEGKLSGVRHSPPNYEYYANVPLIIRILDQNGNRFYGSASFDGGLSYRAFTGVISGGKGYITALNTVITVEQPFSEGGAWRMAGQMQYWDGSPIIDTGAFTVHRTSTTP